MVRGMGSGIDFVGLRIVGALLKSIGMYLLIQLEPKALAAIRRGDVRRERRIGAIS